MSIKMNTELQLQYQQFANKCERNKSKLLCKHVKKYSVGETQNPKKGEIATIRVLMEKKWDLSA